MINFGPMDGTGVLAKLGLRPRMTSFDRSVFRVYTRPSYPDSPEQSRDEVHRMSEIILIHTPTGVRVPCLVEEDYYGENVEYVMMQNIHVITIAGARHRVTDVDLVRETIVTDAGAIPVAETWKEPEDT